MDRILCCVQNREEELQRGLEPLQTTGWLGPSFPAVPEFCAANHKVGMLRVKKECPHIPKQIKETEIPPLLCRTLLRAMSVSNMPAWRPRGREVVYKLCQPHGKGPKCLHESWTQGRDSWGLSSLICTYRRTEEVSFQAFVGCTVCEGRHSMLPLLPEVPCWSFLAVSHTKPYCSTFCLPDLF
jgi:hypothetical protein